MNTAIRRHTVSTISEDWNCRTSTKVAEHMGMTRGAISKMTKKLLAKGLIEKYTLETNKKGSIFQAHGSGQAFV